MPGGRFEDGAQPVRVGFVGPEEPERCRVGADVVAQEPAEDAGRLAIDPPGLGTADGIVAEVRQVEVAKEQAAVGMRVGAHPPVAARGQVGDLGVRRAVRVEELLGPVAAQPLLEQPAMTGVLRGPPRSAPGGIATFPRPACRPLLRARSSPWASAARSSARRAVGPRHPSRASRWIARISPSTRSSVAAICWCIVAGSSPATNRAGSRSRRAGREFLVGDSREDRRIGDLVAIQMEDRQHRAVPGGVEELVGVPAGCQWPGLGLAVADDARHDEVRIVEGRPEGVRERVPELAALMDGARRLGRDMARDAARERELAEQPLHPPRVEADRGVHLA